MGYTFNPLTGQFDITTALSTYIFNQGTPSASWTITHNLGRFPSVTVVDSGGNVVTGDVKYLDTNTLQATFSGGFSGTAYLN